ncbi:hypothetical protein LCGC14_0602150 [marine sediment metagenome]|uniref:ABC transmembrane type-1 domain-containing protein n=1 Tax=marine sediment metagenome TaxID=412755 RepID=A0A0F9RU98_9ZZZZ
MSLLKYIAKRALIAVIMFIVIMTAVWFFIGFIPGSPIDRPLARLTVGFEPFMIEEIRAELLHTYGLDKPFFLQLTDFFGGIFTGNWGLSINEQYEGLEVFDLIKVFFPRTLEIAIIPMIVVNLAAVKVGKYTAIHRGKTGDHVFRGIALVLVSLPAFWVALLLQYAFRELVPAMTFGLIDLPVVGLYSTRYIGQNLPYVTGFRTIDSLLANRLDFFLDTILHLILPAFVFFIAVFGHMLRPARACMLDVIENDYIRTARAKGCTEKDVTNKHAFRNALVPYSTFIGFNVGYFIAGAAYIELIFGFNGLGNAMVTALLATDYFMIRGAVVIFCLINIVVNLTIDVLYAVLDPRITYT